MLCLDCKLVQLQHTTNPNLLYNENYGYKSGINELMCSELADIVDSVVVESGDLVVDIGCNDGTLLSNYPRDVYRVGFDPSLGTNVTSGNNLATHCQENVSRDGAEYKIFRDYFSAEEFEAVFGKRKAKVITAIAMFYDLEDPNKFLRDVKKILADDGTFIIQQNYLVGMLKNVAFDNICHEHLEYYSLTSLERLLDHNGLMVVNTEERDINGGSFRTYIKKSAVSCNCYFTPDRPSSSVEKMRQKEIGMELDSTIPYMVFASKIKNISKALKMCIEDLVRVGKKVYVYGASTRGNSLLQVAGIDHNLIIGAAERNPVKYGKYTAGTKIKIVSEEEARKKADYFLCLPWFLKESFIEREKEFIKKGGHLVFPLPELCVI
jgi:SAM-dependent methyltransferase